MSDKSRSISLGPKFARTKTVGSNTFFTKLCFTSRSRDAIGSAGPRSQRGSTLGRTVRAKALRSVQVLGSPVVIHGERLPCSRYGWVKSPSAHVSRFSARPGLGFVLESCPVLTSRAGPKTEKPGVETDHPWFGALCWATYDMYGLILTERRSFGTRARLGATL